MFNLMKFQYDLKKKLRTALKSLKSNISFSITINIVLTVINTIYLLFNLFPHLNPLCSDLLTLANNNNVSAQIQLANMYYNQGNYEEACNMYLRLTNNSDTKIAGIALNNVSSIYSNYYLNLNLPTFNNTNIIHTIFQNLHKSVDYGNDIAEENLNLFSIYFKDTVSQNETSPIWTYSEQIISDHALVSTDEIKYVTANVQLKSSQDLKSNIYIYTYNVYRKTYKDTDYNFDNIQLQYDITILEYI